MKPVRPPATRNGEIYFVPSATAERTPFFRHERWCTLFVKVLSHYRKETFQLHEFVLMPDHFHLLIAPTESLERAMQLIKGGFSRRAALQFETTKTIWQRGFTDHRIRDVADYDRHKQYIRQNPVNAGMCLDAARYPYCSASSSYDLDPIPKWLKPLKPVTAETVAFQSLETRKSTQTAEAMSLQSLDRMED